MKEELIRLASLLEKRLGVIADHELRDGDPDEQLRQLQEVSAKIDEMHSNLQGRIKPRLAHFLEGCSYQKALDWIEAELRE